MKNVLLGLGAVILIVMLVGIFSNQFGAGGDLVRGRSRVSPRARLRRHLILSATAATVLLVMALIDIYWPE